MNVPRLSHKAILLSNGEVLANGNHFECYAGQFFNPSTNVWSRTTNEYYTGVSLGPLALLGTGKVLLAGGSAIYSDKSSPVARADLYDRQRTRQWVPALSIKLVQATR